jgi:hypothetical protein
MTLLEAKLIYIACPQIEQVIKREHMEHQRLLLLREDDILWSSSNLKRFCNFLYVLNVDVILCDLILYFQNNDIILVNDTSI